MQVTGEEGISVDDFVVYEKARLVDMVYLQQDAFDKVDVSMSLERQKETFLLLLDLVEREYRFADKERARGYFTRLTGLFKNLNYSEHRSREYERFLGEIRALTQEHALDVLGEQARAGAGAEA